MAVVAVIVRSDKGKAGEGTSMAGQRNAGDKAPARHKRADGVEHQQRPAET